MTHAVRRTFTNRGVAIVATIHPQVGAIERGRIRPAGNAYDPVANIWADGREGAGAFGVWEVSDSDCQSLGLVVVGDYLTAEQALLDVTAWADEPIPADEFDTRIKTREG